MIDKFDYAEPSCPLCGGEDFYYPNANKPIDTIPIGRIIEKVDALFARNDYTGAERLLTYWRDEAISLRDKRGELSLESELIGFYRKQNKKEEALSSVKRALVLVEETEQSKLASGATIFINCATAYKAFSMSNEALPLYLRAEEIYKRTLKNDDPRFGGLYNNMALALSDLERYEEAEKAYFSALSVMENAENGELEQAITYINLAHMYEECDKDYNIGECMQKAYGLLSCKKLPHNGYYAFVCEKCAPSFGYFGDKEAYEELKREAERIYAGN